MKKHLFLFIFFCFAHGFANEAGAIGIRAKAAKKEETLKLAPRTRKVAAKESKPEKKIDQNRVLAEQLETIYIVSEYKSRKLWQKRTPGIQIDEGLYVPKEEKLAKDLARRFLNKPVTIKTLEKIRDRIESFYESHGFPLIVVTIPEKQKISNGSLFIEIAIAKIGDVTAAGAKWYSNKWVNKQMKSQVGDYVRTPQLLEDINWINRNPFFNSTLIFEKGQRPYETDVVVLTDDTFPLRVYGGYENTGNIIGGVSRWLTGVNVGRLFLQNDQLNCEFSTSPHLREWWAVVGNYIFPIPWWRNIIKVYGMYSKSYPNLSDTPTINIAIPLAAQDEKGVLWQVGGRYIIPLPAFTSYTHELRLGYDFKRTNNFLNYSKLLFYTNFFDISEFTGIYEGRLQGEWGFAIIGVTFVGSPGKMTRYNRDRYFEMARPGTLANYMYGRGSLDSTIRLPWDFSWEFSFVGQWASGKLLPTEELSIGGYLTVRGYNENELIAKEGVIIRNELRTPTFSVLRSFKNAGDRMQFLGFFDYGYAWGIDQNIYDREDAYLASAGPGVRYTIQDYLSFRFDYGFQLKIIHGRPYTTGDRRMHLGLTASF